MKLIKMPSPEKFLTRAEYAVAVAFEDLLTMNGQCPTVTQIAALAQVHPGTADLAMKKLVKIGHYGRVKGRRVSWFLKKPVPRRGAPTAA